MKIRVFSALALMALAISVVVGATTDRRLSAGYFNGQSIAASDSTTVLYMNKYAIGTTTDPDSMKVARWWTFASYASNDCVIRIYSPGNPNFGGFSDTTDATAIDVTIPGGAAWNSEGLPIYAFVFETGGQLTVIARD